MEAENNSSLIGSFVSKIIACVFILIFLAVGLIGLIMPIIPGLLFLAIAGMISASLFPKVDQWLRRSETMSSYLDSGEGFSRLNFWGKVQYTGWLCLKVFIDSIAFIIAVAAKIWSFASTKYRYYQNN